MNWSSWLLSIAGPIVVKALTYLGLTLVTYQGVDVVFDTLKNHALSSWSALPVAVLQLASLAGVGQALGIVFGAFAARLAVWSAGNMKRLIWK